MKPRVVLISATVLGALAVVITLQRANAPPQPAIFLIVVDTLRPDRLSSYGSSEVRTPNIDRLAEIGTRFSNARAVASWTLPSMGAMLTSLYPSQLGMTEARLESEKPLGDRELRDQRNWTMPVEANTMAERLREAGFRTGAFVDQPALNDLGGFLQGFDDWFTADSSHRIVRRDASDDPVDQQWDGLGPETLAIDRGLACEFDRWLAADPGAPTFAWVHLLTPHGPYISRLASDGRPGASPAARYAAEVRVVDAIVGAILDSIERSTGLVNAHVFFTSDHGEAFGEHGPTDLDHGHSLHDQVIRVPLIIASPAMLRGHTTTASVRTIDILPTMLDLARINSLERDTIEGESLVGLHDEGGIGRSTYAEGMLYGHSERSLVSEGFKLLYDEKDGSFRLYDLRVDPAEQHDRSKARPEQTEEMRSALEAHRAALESRTIWIEGDAATTADGKSRIDSPESALRALGYLE